MARPKLTAAEKKKRAAARKARRESKAPRALPNLAIEISASLGDVDRAMLALGRTVYNEALIKAGS